MSSICKGQPRNCIFMGMEKQKFKLGVCQDSEFCIILQTPKDLDPASKGKLKINQSHKDCNLASNY